jgi:hypothetical protein
METNCGNERKVFRTECRVMTYEDYLKKDLSIPFVDIGHFEGSKQFKSDISIWLDGTVRMETENGSLKLYRPFWCTEFTSFIVCNLYKAKYIMMKDALDEFTYKSFAASIKNLAKSCVPYEIVSCGRISYDEKEIKIPFTKDGYDLKLLERLILVGIELQPMAKYVASNGSIFYIRRNGNIMVDKSCTVSFDEFDKIMYISSLVETYITMVVNDIKETRSDCLEKLMSIISESV